MTKKKLGTIKFWSKKLRLEKNMVQKNVGSKKFGVQNKLVWGNSENKSCQTSLASNSQTSLASTSQTSLGQK